MSLRLITRSHSCIHSVPQIQGCEFDGSAAGDTRRKWSELWVLPFQMFVWSHNKLQYIIMKLHWDPVGNWELAILNSVGPNWELGI